MERKYILLIRYHLPIWFSHGSHPSCGVGEGGEGAPGPLIIKNSWDNLGQRSQVQFGSGLIFNFISSIFNGFSMDLVSL